jgi:hypothetical protein
MDGMGHWASFCSGRRHGLPGENAESDGVEVVVERTAAR